MIIIKVADLKDDCLHTWVQMLSMSRELLIILSGFVGPGPSSEAVRVSHACTSNKSRQTAQRIEASVVQ